MGFSGGGSSQTKPHTHDSNIVNDGGSLQFDNVTQGSLTAGDVVYSDGTHFQRLAIGGAGSTLAVNGGATAPEWASAASGAWTEEGNAINTSPATSLDVDVSDADVYQVLFNVADGGGTSSVVIRLNDVSTTTYRSMLGTMIDGGSMNAELQLQTKWLISNAGSDYGFSGVCYIYKNDSNFSASANAGASYTSQLNKYDGGDPYATSISSGTNDTITGAISKITFMCMKENTSANENIEGSIRVNSLSYS